MTTITPAEDPGRVLYIIRVKIRGRTNRVGTRWLAYNASGDKVDGYAGESRRSLVARWTEAFGAPDQIIGVSDMAWRTFPPPLIE